MTFLRDLRTLWRGRDFRRLFSARLLSQLADGWFQVSLAGLFLFAPEQQTTVAAVAATFAVLLLPYSVLGPFVGVLLDRWRRRQVLVYANLTRAVLVGVVGLIGASDAPDPVLYGAVLVTLAVNRFYLAGLSAGLPHVVAADQLVMANAVVPTAGTLAFVTGLGTGYLLRTLLGGADLRVLPAAALGYLVSALVATRLHRDQLGPEHRLELATVGLALRLVVVGLVDGARHVWDIHPARNALGVIAASRFGYGISLILVILLERNYFNDPADPDAGLAGLAAVFAASGVGFFGAAVLTPPAVRRLGVVRWVATCLVGTAVVDATFMAVLVHGWVVAGALLVGVGAQAVKICVDTTLQRTVGDDYRGRVFAFYDVVFNVVFVAAAAVAALVVPSDASARWVYGAVAAVNAAAGLVYAWRSRGASSPEADGQLADSGWSAHHRRNSSTAPS